MADLFAFIPASQLWMFVMSGIVLNLTPGADVLFATTCGLRGGPRAGAAAGLGAAIGSLWHVALSALGVSALLVAFPSALVALKWAGAGYLLWLAWQSWQAGRGDQNGLDPATITAAAALGRAFVINAANPKVALFMLAFLPQFADPVRRPLWPQIVTLGLIVTVTGGAITATYGAIAGALGTSLATRMSVLNRIAAAMLVMLALWLVWH